MRAGCGAQHRQSTRSVLYNGNMTRIAILIAILCAFTGAIYSSYDSIKKKELELARLQAVAGPLYLFARRDLLVGTVLREGDVVANRVPANIVIRAHNPAFTEEQKSRVIGRRAKYGFSAGQLILEGQLMPR